MDKVHNAVAWYQKKIGSYDKQLWEQSVEQKVLKGIQHAPRKSGRVKTELIDVDLVRGSTFSKAKPQVPWTAITQRAVLRVLFFPLYYKWWVQQTSWRFWCFLLCLYFLHVTASVVYVMNMGDYLTQENVTLTEVLVPFVLMIILALVHSQTVLTHWSHKPLVRDNKTKRDGTRTRTRKHSTRGSGKESGRDEAKAGHSDGKSPKSQHSRSPAKQQQQQHQPFTGNGSACYSNIKDKGSQSELLQTSPSGLSCGQTIDNVLRKVTAEKVPYLGEKLQNGSVTCESNPAAMFCEINQSGLSEKSPSQSTNSSGVSPLNDLSQVKKNDDSGGNVLSESVSDINSKQTDAEMTEKTAACPSGLTTLRKERLEGSCRANGTSEEESSGSLGKFEILPATSHGFCREGVGEKCSSSLNSTEIKQSDVEEDSVPKTYNLDNSFSKDEEDTTSNEDESGCFTNTEVRRKRVYLRSQKKLKELKANPHICRACSLVDDIKSSSPSIKTCEHEITGPPFQESSLQGEATRNCFLKENRSETEDVRDHDCFKVRRTCSAGHSILRRRKSGGTEGSHETLTYTTRTRRVPTSLGVRMQDLKESTGLSSSDGETSPASPLFSKGALSSEEWEFRMQSDVATSTSSASSCASDREMSVEEGEVERTDVGAVGGAMGGANPNMGMGLSATSSSAMHVINLLQPPSSANMSHGHNAPQPDKVSCVIWEGNECKKVDLTALDIGWAIIEKVDAIPESSDYILIGLGFSVLMGLVPLAFRAYLSKTSMDITSLTGLLAIVYSIIGNPWQLKLIAVNGVLQRFCLSMIFFFLLSVADRTFKQRLLYAKHFCYLTSSRRAKKYDMPHFRLNKVRNIKMWLSLRSYLKKRGPQRSVDVIVSSAFMLSITHLAMMCIQLLKDTDKFLDSLCNWELCAWCMALGVYLLRFMTLGLKINKKYRNLSVLITEQINLYLQMEQKPHKKEELMLANNVLKLAEDLLKELESPFKISGMSANPFVYNATKVVLLSAFSTVLTELLGFKLKLYKIKIP